MPKSVLVTNVSGSLGQGVLRILQRLELDIRTVGLSIDGVSAANYFCPTIHHLPYSLTDSSSINVDAVRRICQAEDVELIIPCTDVEALVFSEHFSLLPTLACSPFRTSAIFYDKYITAQKLAEVGLPFAESCLPSEYHEQFESVVVKPRSGGLSRDVYFDPPNTHTFTDRSVVQRKYTGTELTSSFYVTNAGRVHAQLTMERQLRYGMTFSCRTTRAFDAFFQSFADVLASKFGVRGSCNVQSITEPDGKITPFEINCRISGATTIRSNFGFQDVRYAVEEHIFQREPSPPTYRDGCAVRMITDLIYPGVQLEDIRNPGTCLPYFF